MTTTPKSKTIKLSKDTYSRFFTDDEKSDEVAKIIEKALEMYFKAEEQELESELLN